MSVRGFLKLSYRSNVRRNDKLSFIQNALTANTRNHMMNSIGVAGGTSDFIHTSQL